MTKFISYAILFLALKRYKYLFYRNPCVLNVAIRHDY